MLRSLSSEEGIPVMLSAERMSLARRVIIHSTRWIDKRRRRKDEVRGALSQIHLVIGLVGFQLVGNIEFE